MAAYHGGKQKIGKELAKVIFDGSIKTEKVKNFEIKGYCEPFCGMLGVYQHIPALFKNHQPPLKYLAGDTNNSVILMWKAAQNKWKPPTTCLNNQEYNRLRYLKEDSAEKGFIGHQCAFGGVYFGAYAPNYGKKNNQTRASQKVINVANQLKDTVFSHGDYTQFSDLKHYIIYCDPPYYQTAQKYQKDFDSVKFWDWCEKMSKENVIFVSEYSAPEGFKKVWTKKIKSGGYRGYKSVLSEKLFAK